MSEDGKTEVEFAGVKFRGGKIFVIVTALSTLGGGLYAGFEFWKDYMDMKEKIETYVAPDLSGFDKRIAIMESRMNEEVDLFKEEMNVLKNEVKLIAGVNRDMKVDMKQDVRRIEKIVEDTEQRVKEDSREFSTAIRSLEKETDTRLKTMEKDLDLKVKKALNNPLSAISK
tara:strand:- start:1381 stop:1893 length:513 start_codon:yes stop_codon:yes gene_type:complete